MGRQWAGFSFASISGDGEDLGTLEVSRVLLTCIRCGLPKSGMPLAWLGVAAYIRKRDETHGLDRRDLVDRGQR